MFRIHIFLKSPAAWIEFVTDQFPLADVLLVKMPPTQARRQTEAFLGYHLSPLLERFLWRMEKCCWTTFRIYSGSAPTDKAMFVNHFRDDALKKKSF